MDKLVIDFQDYYELAHDKRVAARNVNRLNDPNFFFKTARRFSASQQEVLKVAKKYMEDAYAEFMRKRDVNQLLGDIYDKFRVFILPEDINDFVSGKKLPSEFIDVATKIPIEKDSARYVEIIKYLKEFEEAMGYKFENMPEIIEEEEETEEVVEKSVDLQPVTPVVTKPLTTDMAVVDLPKEVVAQLRAQFRIDNNNLINAGQTAMMDTEFAKWLQSSINAANIIYNYNIANNLIDKNTPRPQVSEKAAKVVTELVKFEDLTPNTLLEMKDTSMFPLKGRARVIETNATDRTITVQPVGTEERFTFAESEIPNQITSIFKKGVTTPEVTPEVTAAEQELSNENLSAVTTEEELINTINEDVEKAKSKTKEERDNDLLNSLGCK